ncbi:hypothetical protein [Streptomyces sp. NPDC048392]|uniref:hypothetical protein n=1 Tax=Streptomyces sp. NPDC048392 TaxID=3365543 RepID=UPI00371253B1
MTDERNGRNEIERIIKEARGASFGGDEDARVTDALIAYMEASYLPHEETTELVVQARLEELLLVQRVIAAVVDAQSEGNDEDVTLRLLEHIGERRNVIKTVAARRPD